MQREKREEGRELKAKREARNEKPETRIEKGEERREREEERGEERRGERRKRREERRESREKREKKREKREEREERREASSKILTYALHRTSNFGIISVREKTIYPFWDHFSVNRCPCGGLSAKNMFCWKCSILPFKIKKLKNVCEF